MKKIIAIVAIIVIGFGTYKLWNYVDFINYDVESYVTEQLNNYMSGDKESSLANIISLYEKYDKDDKYSSITQKISNTVVYYFGKSDTFLSDKYNCNATNKNSCIAKALELKTYYDEFVLQICTASLSSGISSVLCNSSSDSKYDLGATRVQIYQHLNEANDIANLATLPITYETERKNNCKIADCSSCNSGNTCTCSYISGGVTKSVVCKNPNK